ncbi:hypothetical protein BD414DRAFT_486419 [Trametes punicea]|nr:hypothetical protein BD414DRAFT_486419 [Trametes punicea]
MVLLELCTVMSVNLCLTAAHSTCPVSPYPLQCTSQCHWPVHPWPVLFSYVLVLSWSLSRIRGEDKLAMRTHQSVPRNHWSDAVHSGRSTMQVRLYASRAGFDATVDSI